MNLHLEREQNIKKWFKIPNQKQAYLEYDENNYWTFSFWCKNEIEERKLVHINGKHIIVFNYWLYKPHYIKFMNIIHMPSKLL